MGDHKHIPGTTFWCTGCAVPLDAQDCPSKGSGSLQSSSRYMWFYVGNTIKIPGTKEVWMQIYANESVD